MKTYKVLEAHIGEDPHNPYMPGDETYGTRTMAATEAKALIDMGLLGEIEEDAPAPAPVPAPAPEPALELATAPMVDPAPEPTPAPAPEPAPAAEQPAATPVASRRSASKAH